jgi:head-tail adaptor
LSDGIDAGELDRRVTVLRSEIIDDGFSATSGEPTPVGRRWAKKTDVSDGEKVAAAAQGRTLTSRFLVRWDSLTAAITGDYHLECEGVVYEVTGTKEARGRRVGIEITAKALR